VHSSQVHIHEEVALTAPWGFCDASSLNAVSKLFAAELTAQTSGGKPIAIIFVLAP